MEETRFGGQIRQVILMLVNIFMEQNKQPVKQYYYSEKERDRIGCGPLPQERDRAKFQDAHAKGNPPIDNNLVKGYN